MQWTFCSHWVDLVVDLVGFIGLPLYCRFVKLGTGTQIGAIAPKHGLGYHQRAFQRRFFAALVFSTEPSIPKVTTWRFFRADSCNNR